MTELDRKIKELKDFIKQKTDQGTANYLGKEIREICGMVESEQLLIHGVVVPKGTLCECGNKELPQYSPCCSLKCWHDQFD